MIHKKNHEEIYNNLLRDIYKNPSKYIRRPSLKYLRPFINGYRFCGDANAHIIGNITWDTTFDTKPSFYDFIKDKYKIETSRHYFCIIDFFHSSEEDAFYKYFDLLYEYKEISTFTHKKLPEMNGEEVELHLNQGLDTNEVYYKLLSFIHKKPGAFIGFYPSLRLLEAFLNGYITFIHIYKLPFDPHPGFKQFVKAKYNVTVSKNVYDIIDFHHITESFNEFFKLLGEYLKFMNMTRFNELLDLGN